MDTLYVEVEHYMLPAFLGNYRLVQRNLHPKYLETDSREYIHKSPEWRWGNQLREGFLNMECNYNKPQFNIYNLSNCWNYEDFIYNPNRLIGGKFAIGDYVVITVPSIQSYDGMMGKVCKLVARDTDRLGVYLEYHLSMNCYRLYLSAAEQKNFASFARFASVEEVSFYLTGSTDTSRYIVGSEPISKTSPAPVKLYEFNEPVKFKETLYKKPSRPKLKL